MGKLTDKDHELLDRFIGVVLDRYRDGKQSRGEAIGAIAHLVAAIDRPDGDNPRKYMEAVIEDEGN